MTSNSNSGTARASNRLLIRADGRGFFVVDPLRIRSGGCVVVDPDGGTYRLDAAALAPFRVSPSRARREIADSLRRSVVGAVAAMREALPETTVEDTRPAESRDSPPEPSSEVPSEPPPSWPARADAGADLRALLADTLPGAPSDAGTRPNAVDLGASPEETARWVAALRTIDPESAAAVASGALRSLGELRQGDPATLGRRLDELVERFDREIGPLLHDPAATSPATRHQQYRSSANQAIAASLRAAGITPIASATDPADDTQGGSPK